MIGHKLRTPLVGILGGLNILSSGAATMSRDNIARIANVALDGARRLRAEIEDILNYLRPPADPYGAEIPTVAEIAETAAHTAAELGISAVELQHEPAIDPNRVNITRHSLEVALREILENAVKFHPHHAPLVTIQLNIAAPGLLALRIADNGPGLAPDMLTLAWRPYYQGERSFTGQVEGMGLGLPLVARIVHAVGGRCEIANRDDAPGAAVTLTLPLAEG
jgi:signal transduction histidine kinase